MKLLVVLKFIHTHSVWLANSCFFKNLTNYDIVLFCVSPRPPGCYTAPQACCWGGWKETPPCKESPTSLSTKCMRGQKKGKRKVSIDTLSCKAKTWLKNCPLLPAEFHRLVVREPEDAKSEGGVLSWSPRSVVQWLESACPSLGEPLRRRAMSPGLVHMCFLCPLDHP